MNESDVSAKLGLSFTSEDEEKNMNNKQTNDGTQLSIASLRISTIPTLVVLTSSKTGSYRLPNLMTDHASGLFNSGSSFIDPETGRCIRCGAGRVMKNNSKLTGSEERRQQTRQRRVSHMTKTHHVRYKCLSVRLETIISKVSTVLQY